MSDSLNKEFLQNGFVIVKNAFDPCVCPRAWQELERIHHSYMDLKMKFPELHRLGEWSIKSPHVASSVIKDFIFSSLFQRLCLELIGDTVDLFWAATAAKPKERGKGFPWHQDTGYDEDPKDYITIWAAFDQVDEGNGCLWAVPGSHLEEVLQHEFRKTDEFNYAGVFIKSSYSPAVEAIPIRLNPGDVVCMHSKLVHASFQNSSPRERRGLIAAFIKSFRYDIQQVRGIPEGTEPFLRNGKILIR